VTSASPAAGANFGRVHPAHADRYAMAEEFVGVVRGLWDCWADDAIVADRATGRYIDPAKVRALDHAGPHFRVKGPLNIGRAPQGRPVILQAGGSDRGQLLAARTGQRLMRTGPVLAEACAFLAHWTEAMRGHPAVNTFAAAAIREIWFRSSGEIPYEACARLYRETFGQDRPTDNPQLIEAVQDNSRRLIRKGHWESPVVDIHGEWFFAHERLGEIASRLQQLSAS